MARLPSLGVYPQARSRVERQCQNRSSSWFSGPVHRSQGSGAAACGDRRQARTGRAVKDELEPSLLIEVERSLAAGLVEVHVLERGLGNYGPARFEEIESTPGSTVAVKSRSAGSDSLSGLVSTPRFRSAIFGVKPSGPKRNFAVGASSMTLCAWSETGAASAQQGRLRQGRILDGSRLSVGGKNGLTSEALRPGRTGRTREAPSDGHAVRRGERNYR